MGSGRQPDIQNYITPSRRRFNISKRIKAIVVLGSFNVTTFPLNNNTSGAEQYLLHVPSKGASSNYFFGKDKVILWGGGGGGGSGT